MLRAICMSRMKLLTTLAGIRLGNKPAGRPRVYVILVWGGQLLQAVINLCLFARPDYLSHIKAMKELWATDLKTDCDPRTKLIC